MSTLQGVCLLVILAGVAGCHRPRPLRSLPTVQYGLAQLARAEQEVGCTFAVFVSDPGEAISRSALSRAGLVLDQAAESFAVIPEAGGARVIGRDAVGAGYALLELAEQIRAQRSCTPSGLFAHARSPAVPIRAANLFLVLPAKDEASWWFRDMQFWTEYLDLLARARINFLDLHGMYNLYNTVFPNALLYFARSETYPDVGVPAAEAEKNLATLNQVIGLAAQRGMRVGLMSYRSDLSLTGDSGAKPPDEAQLAIYIREAAEDLARRAPGLSWLGFRTGESGHPAAWYSDTFVAGVRAAGTGVQIYTRTWLSKHQEVLSLVRAAGDGVIVEAKYNGEHLAAPYVIAGGAFSDWSIYSYEDYLTPPLTYDFIFQVRAGGTHRIFRQASYELARRMAPSFTFGGARGFTLEAPHAYFPQRDYYHASSADRFSEWTFQRDELQYLLLGRLAYDPTTPESIFREALRARVGTDELWDPVQAASEIVPWIQLGHTCGPDHRDFAPELEWGGSVGFFSLGTGVRPPPELAYCNHHGQFDSFALANAAETAEDFVTGRGTSRVTWLEIARRVLDASVRARKAASVVIDSANPEARDVQRECLALADLGEYFGHKIRGATALAVYARSRNADYLGTARDETALADAAFRALAADTAYIAPFEDKLRMSSLGLRQFHWREELPWLARDPASIDYIMQQAELAPLPPPRAFPPAREWLDAPRAEGPGLLTLTSDAIPGKQGRWIASVKFLRPVPPGASVNVLWKRFAAASSNRWQSVPATGDGQGYSAPVGDGTRGVLVAVEVVGGPGVGWRYPDVLQSAPYIVIKP